MTPSDSASDRSPEELLLESFLERHPQGSSEDFEAWTKGRAELQADPGLAERLREIHGHWKRAADLLGSPQAASGQAGASFFGPRSGGAPLEPMGAPGASNLQPGDSVGHFILGRFLAQGGMGQVWEAHDQGLRMDVALKLILPGRVNPRSLDLFAREARAGGRLRHPYIVSTLSAGKADDLTWIAQELVEGSWTVKDSLDDLRAQDALPTDYYKNVALLIARVAEGLHAAHKAGVIHRDVKPANILIAPDDTPRLTDFGLARVVDDSFHSQSGELAGTWSYMSPEQVTAKRMGLDHRTDIFSLGVVLYEMLTLRRPFEGDTTHQIAEQIVTSDPPQPRKLRSQCPSELATICGKAIEKAPGRRYQSMDEFAADLHRHLAHEPILARPPGALVRMGKWVQRHQVISASAALGLVALTVISVLLVVVARTADEKAAQVVIAEQLAVEKAAQVRVVEGERDKARQQSYLANIFAAGVAIKDGNMGEAHRRLKDCPAELRGWEWEHLRLKSDQALLVLEGHEGPVNQVAWSPDGTRLASASNDGTVRIWDPETGSDVAILKGHESTVYHVAWSPDGEQLASASSDGAVRLWDAIIGTEIAVLESHSGKVAPIAWSPDGTRLASASGDGTVHIWDPKKATGVAVLEGHSSQVVYVGWSPNGTRLASASDDGTVRIWDPENAMESAVLEGHAKGANHVAWSPDGAQLASVSSVGNIHVWDVKSGDVFAKLLSRGAYYKVAWSPDGGRIALFSSSSALHIWNPNTDVVIASAERRERGEFFAIWSPDGARIASASLDDAIRIWNAETCVEIVVLNGHEDRVSDLSWSPDGTRLASASWDDTIRIWSSTIGAPISPLEGDEYYIDNLLWSSDSARLVSTSGGGTIRTWNAETGAKISVLRKGEGSVEHVARISPDGQRIASALLDDTIRIWNAKTGVEVAVLEGHTDSVVDIAWNPDGTRLVSASLDNTIRSWNARTGAELAVLGAYKTGVGSVAWSSDGARIVASVGATGMAHYILDSQTGVFIAALEGHEGYVTHIVWSPDGKRLASASTDRTVRIWDSETGAQITVLEGHADEVNGVAWSPDGLRLASASEDGTVCIWSVATGSRLAVLEGHWDSVEHVAWSPDGTRLVTASFGGQVLVWHTSLQTAGAWGRNVDLRRRALAVVDPLFIANISLEQVLRAIEQRESLTQEVREKALLLARDYGDSTADELNIRAWNLIAPNENPTGQEQLALWLSRRAVELDSERADIRDTLAWAFFANGLHDEALAASERALELANENNKSGYRGSLEKIRTAIQAANREGNEPSKW